jgi:hypothetical protein
MQRISFNPAMLAALQAGAKTVTRRRLFSDLPMQQQPARYRFVGVTTQGAIFEDLHTRPHAQLVLVPCPLGKVGDKLLVLENPGQQLQLVNVRAERVRQITDADALAEGIQQREVQGLQQWGGVEPTGAIPETFQWYTSPLDAFQALLDSIYPTTWSRNEWVWVIEFRLLASE